MEELQATRENEDDNVRCLKRQRLSPAFVQFDGDDDVLTAASTIQDFMGFVEFVAQVNQGFPDGTLDPDCENAQSTFV